MATKVSKVSVLGKSNLGDAIYAHPLSLIFALYHIHIEQLVVNRPMLCTLG